MAFLTSSLPLPSPFDPDPSPFDPEPSRESADTTVQATFVNDSLLLCIAPPYIRAQSAALRLTLNGQQFTEPPTSFPFFSVASLSPSTGALLGGTLGTWLGLGLGLG